MKNLFFIITCFCFYLSYSLTTQAFRLGSSINNYTGFDDILDTICIGDTMTMKWIDYEEFGEDFSFSWNGMEEYFYVLSPYGRDSLVLMPKTTIPFGWSNIHWRAVVRWRNAQNDIDSASLSDETFPIYCSPESRFTADKQSVCAGDCVQFSNRSTHLPDSTVWHFEGGEPAEYVGKDPPPICYAQAGTYAVRLLSSNPVGIDFLLKSDYISVYEPPEGNSTNEVLELRQGETAMLTPCANALHYDWYADSILVCTDCSVYSSPALYRDQLVQCIAYNDSNAPCDVSCAYSLKITDIRDGVLVPNAFSPNNDGVNDCVRPIPHFVTISHFGVYNRWGELVYEQAGNDACWDGYGQHSVAEQGVYVYVVEYTRWYDQKQQTTKGSITLMR